MSTSPVPQAERPAERAAGLDRCVLTETTMIAVDAPAAATTAAVERLDLAAPLARALEALDVGGRFALIPGRIGDAAAGGRRLFGTVWCMDAARTVEPILPERFDSFRTPGYVKVRWAVTVAATDGGALLHMTSRFSATDDRSARCLLDAWGMIGPLSHAVREHAAHAVKDYAEELAGE